MNPIKKIEEWKKTDRDGYYKQMHFNARNNFFGDTPDVIDMEHPEKFIPADHDLGLYMMIAHVSEMVMDLHKRLDEMEKQK